MIKNFMIAFLISFSLFSLIIMLSVVIIHPFSTENDTNFPTNILLPTQNEQLDLLLQWEKRGLFHISMQPQHGQIIITPLINDYIPENITPVEKEISVSADSISENFCINRTIFITDTNAANMINLIGGITVPIEFSPGPDSMSETLTEYCLSGEQILTYLEDIPDRQVLRVEQILSSFLRKLMLLSTSERFYEIFIQILNHVESDLRASDFNQYYPAFKFMSSISVDPIYFNTIPTFLPNE